MQKTGLFLTAVILLGLVVGVFFYTAPSVQSYNQTSLFPKTVKEVTGRDYLTTPFPKTEATNTILCPVKWGEDYDAYEAYAFCRTRPNPTANNLPAFPYSAPIKNFVGRYLDGAGMLSNKGEWYAFYGGEDIKFVPSKNRIYMKQGDTLVAYKLDKFFTRIATEPLKFFYRQAGTALVEAMIPWDDYFYIGKPEDSGWRIYYGDVSRIFNDYDIDDRGFLYLSSVSGWGIIKDDGTTLRPVSEMLVGHDKEQEVRTGTRGSNKVFNVGNEGLTEQIFSFKAGTNYYVATADDNNPGIQIWNVTDPYNPKYHHAENIDGTGYGASLIKTKIGNKEIIALLESETRIGWRKKISIYNAEDFASGMGSKKSFELPDSAEGYSSLVADPNGRIFAIAYGRDSEGKAVKEGGKMSLVVLTPTAGGDASSYTETAYDLGRYSVQSSRTNLAFTPSPTDFEGGVLSYNSGLLTVTGYRYGTYDSGPGISWEKDIKMWDLRSGVPKEIDFKDYFFKRYSEPPVGYGIANAYKQIINGQTYSAGGKTYLFVSTYGQGEVYELEVGPISSSTSTSTSSSSPTSTNRVRSVSPSNPLIPPAVTSTNRCFNEYRELCDKVQVLRRNLCVLFPDSATCKGDGSSLKP